MKRLLTLLTATLMAATVINAANGIPEKILQLNKQNKTIIASFTEHKSMPKLKKETQKEGTLYFDGSTDKLLLSYTDPAGDYSLIKEGVMYVKKANKEQKFAGQNKESRMSIFKASLLNAMHGDINAIAETNNATVKATEEKTTYTCILTTDGAQKHGIQQLKLVYDKQNGALLSLTITEGNGNFTTYATKQPKLNEPIKSDIFIVK